MTVAQALLAFAFAASILTITPGVDTAMVLRSAASGGPRNAIFAGLGISLGCLLWGALVSLGLGALLAASPTAFLVLKWAGAAYLLWLGMKLLLHPRIAPDPVDGAVTQARPTAAFRQGLATNLLNPKIGVFYITFLPQFIPVGASVASFSFVLAALHAAIGMAWFGVLIAATVPLGRILARPRVVRAMDRMTGVVFVGFGVRLALAR